MGDEDRATTAFDDPGDEPLDEVDGVDVEGGVGFVEEQELGFDEELAGELGASLHAVGAGRGEPVGGPGEAHLGEDLAHPVGGEAEDLGGEAEVLRQGQVGVEAGEVPDVADPPPHLEPRVARDVDAEDPRRAGAGPPEGGDDPEHGGLPGAVGAEEPDGLAGLDDEVQVPEDRRRPDVDPKGIEADEGLHGPQATEPPGGADPGIPLWVSGLYAPIPGHHTRSRRETMATIELTKENFEKTILDNDTVLVDFWADWCGPCKMFAPVYEKMSEKYPDIVFGKVDTEKEPELAGYFGIRSIPTLMAFREQIGVFSQPGALPEQVLEDLIEQIRALDMDAVREEIAQHEAAQGTDGHDH